MSGRIFQNVVVQMKESIDRPVGVADDMGMVVAATDLSIVGTKLDDFEAAVQKNVGQSFVTSQRSYCPLNSDSGKTEYYAFASGSDSGSKALSAVAAIAFSEAKNSYE